MRAAAAVLTEAFTTVSPLLRPLCEAVRLTMPSNLFFFKLQIFFEFSIIHTVSTQIPFEPKNLETIMLLSKILQHICGFLLHFFFYS